MDDSDTLDNTFDDSLADEFEYLQYEVDGNIAVITIDRPDALNALNADLLFELSAAFDLAEADYNVRALIITGTGRAFIAGADIANLQNLSDVFGGREASLTGQELTNALAAMPFPTIAAINGFALGGGARASLSL
jgi:enoyl-CoA hydratase